VLPEASQTEGSAEFPGPGLLLAGQAESVLKMRRSFTLGLARVPSGLVEHLPPEAIQLRLITTLSCAGQQG
jgi:hypothetical protein